jgi:predicted ribosomally synthesized peptide with SipW-like signal peptide
MSKQIIISLSIIAAVAAIAVGATTSYFSDTETSTGNTFTAGSIDLKVDNTCHYDGMECVDGHWNGTEEPCSCTWTEDDLTGDNHLFFDFADLKPGDWGEDTISLHVHENDAWACMEFKDEVSKDNSCTEPEILDDLSCSDPDGQGELDDNLDFAFWADVCDQGNAHPGDNIYQPDCDRNLVTGDANNWFDVGRQALADKEVNIFEPGAGNPLIGSNTYYLGLAWCFGDISVNSSTGAISCNGSSVNNASQTDSLTGTLEFYAEQYRNNPDFTCTSQ